MKCKAQILVIFLFLFSLFLPCTSFAETKKFRVIYVDGGDYSDYQRIFHTMTLSLQDMGLLRDGDVPIPRDSESMRGIWHWIVKNGGGDTIEFLPDGYYSGEYNAQKTLENRDAILRRIREKNDVDAILCFGTRAAKSLAHTDISVPILMCSVSDAVGAGIVPSQTDSGKDNLVAIINKDVYKRDLHLFYDIFKFTKLGIVYEDSQTGRDVIALPAIEATAKELGVELLHCTPKPKHRQMDDMSDDLMACHRKLANDGVQAVYITCSLSLTEQNARRVLDPLTRASIPTFSQLGNADVRLGALMSSTESSNNGEGLFAAQLLVRIMRGEKPRSLPQVFTSRESLAINLRTATAIGWNPSIEILASVDEFY